MAFTLKTGKPLRN